MNRYEEDSLAQQRTNAAIKAELEAKHPAWHGDWNVSGVVWHKFSGKTAKATPCEGHDGKCGHTFYSTKGVPEGTEVSISYTISHDRTVVAQDIKNPDDARLMGEAWAMASLLAGIADESIRGGTARRRAREILERLATRPRIWGYTDSTIEGRG
jgi:hypothetical protein